jgi:hypothetical protein
MPTALRNRYRTRYVGMRVSGAGSVEMGVSTVEAGAIPGGNWMHPLLKHPGRPLVVNDKVALIRNIHMNDMVLDVQGTKRGCKTR